MIQHAVRGLAVFAAALAVIACGGGTVAGVGSGGSGFGLAAGTVTGFGSVIVDGERWDVRNARIEIELDPSRPPVLAEAELGQQVEIDFADSGIANTVRVEAEVIGRVDGVDAAAQPPVIAVAGQTVRINTDPDRGPVTFFVGYASIADVQANDAIEVHGAARFDAAAGRYTIQATRIEKLATLPAGLIRVAGVVEALGPGTFRLGGLTVNTNSSTVIVPAARALANGQRVIVWGAEPLGAGPALTASFVRIKDAPPASGAAEVSGSIGRLDVARQTFEIHGIAVNARNGNVMPAAQALADGAYVVARGAFRADGTLDASQVRIRRKAFGDVQVELNGVITAFAGAGDFLVRGVRVDASAAAMQGCGAMPLAGGMFVEVQGDIENDIVKAVRVACDATPPAGATLTFNGIASGVSTGTRTFVLTTAGMESRIVTWTDKTLFVDVLPATLSGKTVEVDAYMHQGGLVATRIELAN